MTSAQPVCYTLGGVTVNIADHGFLVADTARRKSVAPHVNSSAPTRSCTYARKLRSNPARCVDVVSRIAFPVMFAVFNAVYWSHFD